MTKQRILKTLAVMVVLLCVAAVPALALSSKAIVTDVSPDSGSAKVSADTNITATFNIRMAKSTINNKTFYLRQEGSTAVVPAQVTYAGTSKTATLNPNIDLASGATYTAYVKGGRTGVRGAGGQKLGGTTDSTATFAEAKVSWTFTTKPDTTGPNASITDGPPSHVNTRSASFTFSGAEPGGSYQCKIDSASSPGTFSACSSGESVTVEADGIYTFSVQASDALGNFGTPASRTWTVDTVAPDAPSVHLDANSNSGSQSDDITNDSTPTISGKAESGSTVKIYNAQNTFVASATVGNDGTWSHTFSALTPDGSYSFTVKAADAADNESQGSSISLTIDTVAPETTLGDKPASLVNSASATFTFSSSESGSSFECSLDGAPFASCTSPKSYSGLADGSHTFSVRATDAARNTDSTPASYTWTVEAAAPTVTFTPADTTDVAPNTNVRATFSEAMNEASVEAPGTFTLKQGSSPVAATVTYDPTTKQATLDPSTDLALNTTYTATLTTEAKDLAGNALAQEGSWTFTTANAPRSVTVTPATLDLSPTDVLWCVRSEKLTVTNNGPGDVTFAEASITGTDARYFSDGAKSFIVNNGPFTVLDGNHFFDPVTFTAGSTPAERNSKFYTATLTYKDDTGATIGNPVSLTANPKCLVF